MRDAVCAFATLLVIGSGCAFAAADPDPRDYGIRSLNTPDPIFTSADSVAIGITADSTARVQRAVVRLNGSDVTSAFALSQPGVRTGTVARTPAPSSSRID